MDLRKLIDTNPAPPPNQGVEDVTGPVEEGLHPTLGSVRSVDAEPHMAGKSLGKHLSQKSIGGWILAIFKHPKATLHLASGKLEQMRETKPEKYLQELSQLAQTKSDWQLVFTEAQTLQKDAHPELQEKIQGWQYVAFGEIAERAPTKSMDKFIEHLGMVEGLANQMDGIPFMHTSTQPSSGIQLLNKMATTAARRAKPNSAARMLPMLESINDRIRVMESVGKPPLTKAIQLLEERASSEVPPDIVSDTPRDVSGQYHASLPDAFLEGLGELPVISELDFPDELVDIQNTLLHNPNDAEAWEDYQEIESEISDKARQLFLRTLYNTHRTHIGIAKLVVFHGLQATPEKEVLWNIYDKISHAISPEDQVAFLDSLFQQDDLNPEVRGRLLGALNKLEGQQPYDQMREDIYKKS